VNSGLLTNVGMVVANAAYDTNTTNIEVSLSLRSCKVYMLTGTDVQ
jgi:hypothetical protein